MSYLCQSGRSVSLYVLCVHCRQAVSFPGAVTPFLTNSSHSLHSPTRPLTRLYHCRPHPPYPPHSPYSEYGAIPTDTIGPSKCGAHHSDALGWHYHAVIGYGELKNAFVVCYQGYRAVQEWDGTVYGEDDSVAPGNCPSTTYTVAHNIEDSMGAYFAATGSFSLSTCEDG